MTTKAKTEAPITGADPDALATALEKLGALEAQNAKLTALVTQLAADTPLAGILAAPGPKPVRRTRETPAPAPMLAVRKLYFTGTRLNRDHGHIEADLYPSPEGVPVYVCGRGGSPVVFKGSADDERPHAFVHQSFGDWLIANDCPHDPWGKPLAARYAWAD